MRVIAYLCQYKGDQALSTEAQLEQIQIYASRHHLEIIEIIKDTQHVADLRNQSGLKKALNRCQSDPDLGFIVARLDCLLGAKMDDAITQYGYLMQKTHPLGVG